LTRYFLYLYSGTIFELQPVPQQKQKLHGRTTVLRLMYITCLLTLLGLLVSIYESDYIFIYWKYRIDWSILNESRASSNANLIFS